jgi:hypothetical protein
MMDKTLATQQFLGAPTEGATVAKQHFRRHRKGATVAKQHFRRHRKGATVAQQHFIIMMNNDRFPKHGTS